MTQETGETRDAIIETDEKIIQDIINANSHRTDPYWIVLFAKGAKGSVDGKPTLVKHIKAYPTKPSPQVGMIIGEVDNKKGDVTWQVNMPQAPFDYEALGKFGVEKTSGVITETTTIPHAYVTG